MTETRQTFAGLSHWEIVFWYGLIVVSTAIFFWGVARLVLRYRRGREQQPFELGGLPRRVARAAGIVFTHRWIRRRDLVAGLGHALIFYGFLVLFAGTAILAFQDDVAKPLLGFDFWRGSFYLGYSLVLDVFGVGLAVGLGVMAVKRLRHPARLDYRRPDREEDRSRYVIGDWVFVASLFFLALTGFLLEAFRITQTNPSFETWSPIGWAVGHAFRGLGMTAQQASSAHFATWWTHGVVALAFVASIPFTKAVHMLTAPANVAVRDDLAGKRLPPLPADAKPEQIGYGRIADLTWEHLVSLDACTKCGKCHVVCPANASGYPLSPRDLILDLRELSAHSGPDAEIGERVRPETIWSCTQCMACVEICPVGIEHVPIINQLRRRLVERGELDAMLQSTLEAVYETGNSFGEPKRKRPRWTRELGFEVKDIRREPAELLWFVGDYASFDARNQRATQSLARILESAGADFGILFDAEKTAGCDVRRAGEEGLWSDLAEENVRTISGCEFERIFSSDPHTFHTLRNEYPLHGGVWTVLHHSQLLLELLESGALVPAKRLDYRVTYHDPCTLGRYNGVYEAPRQVLQALGCELVEMPRNRDNSFCCGAGGGRIWMKELKAAGARRPSEQRIDEATALGALDYFVVACPKDVTMYEDAIKTSGHQGELELRELSELVLEALDLPVPVSVAEPEEVS
ncbi:MAG TPA: heterodisulfide reductase-related iron-sulfur binding cluster [Gaiellaceae bacterium]